MKVFAVLVLVLAIAAWIVYADGARLPVNHTVSVTGTVAAPPEKVFALITDVKDGSNWRPQVKSVTILDPGKGADHWVEHYAYGQFMTFLAVQTTPSTLRQVKLDDAHATYGGTWTYELTPGPDPATTTLRITENGFIKPPVYRFAMARVLGPTKNLDDYMKAIQAAAHKP